MKFKDFLGYRTWKLKFVFRNVQYSILHNPKYKFVFHIIEFGIYDFRFFENEVARRNYESEERNF